jgi:hypothetical protein
MANAIIATNQPTFLGVGPISLTSAQAYDAAVATTTAPSTTSQSALILSPGNDYPSLLRLTPFAGANNYTAVGVRVVGWNTYLQTSGTKIYVPTVLADLTMGYTSGTVDSESVDGNTVFFFSSVTVGSGVPTVNVYSPATAASANVQYAHAVVDTIGSQFVTLQFKATGTTPTMGAFYTFI